MRRGGVGARAALRRTDVTADQLRHICERPGMYVQRPHFRSVCAYVQGWDDARGRGPLQGFREWLVVRSGGPNALVWSALVEFILMPGVDMAAPTDEQERACLRGLADLFEEFAGYRPAVGLIDDPQQRPG